MKRVLTAAVLIPAVLLLTLKAPFWLFTTLAALVAIAATHEYMNLVKAMGFSPSPALNYLFLVTYFAFLGLVGSRIEDGEGGAVFFLLAGSTAVAPAFLYGLAALREDLRTAISTAALSWFGFIYVSFALATLVLIRAFPLGPLYLLYLFLVVWSGDISAYYVGSSLGRHKLAPEVSPKKTWEGAIASALAAGLLGGAALHYAPELVHWAESHGLIGRLDWPAGEGLFESLGAAGTTPGVHSFPWWKAALCSALINVAAQFGDLVESAIKRGAGVKDSGTLLPGHGGVLDRIDALLFAAPFAFAVILFAINAQ